MIELLMKECIKEGFSSAINGFNEGHHDDHHCTDILLTALHT